MFSDLIGIPFIYGETDCWAIVRKGFKKFGIDIPEYNLAREAVKQLAFDPSEAGRIIWEQRSKWKELEKPETPCLVFMTLGLPDTMHHLALYIGNNKILHTRKDTSSCIEKLSKPLYATREKSYWKYVG